MIKLIKELPEINTLSAELVKLHCLFDSYKDDKAVLFWEQTQADTLISLADGNMIISGTSPNTQELKEFIAVVSPISIFTSENVFEKLGYEPQKRVHIMHRKADITECAERDEMTSEEIYELLNVPVLELPPYPDFAVDYCRRKNKGYADYFALKKKCAGIAFNTENYAILSGIASHEKGYGSVALKALLKYNFGKQFLVCCRSAVKGFYEKNGFREIYKAGYWVKNR